MATVAPTRPLRRAGADASQGGRPGADEATPQDPKAAKKAAKAAKKAAKEGGKPGGKKKMVLILAALLVVGGGGYKVMGAKAKPARGAAVAKGVIDSLDPLTVNLADGHLLQVGVALQLTVVAKADKVTADAPEVQDAIISVFSAWTYPALLGPSSHDQARAQLEGRIQALFPPVNGEPQVSGVYFTSFVMQ